MRRHLLAPNRIPHPQQTRTDPPDSMPQEASRSTGTLRPHFSSVWHHRTATTPYTHPTPNLHGRTHTQDTPQTPRHTCACTDARSQTLPGNHREGLPRFPAAAGASRHGPTFSGSTTVMQRPGATCAQLPPRAPVSAPPCRGARVAIQRPRRITPAHATLPAARLGCCHRKVPTPTPCEQHQPG